MKYVGLFVTTLLVSGCVFEERVGGAAESQPAAFATTRWAIALGGPGDSTAHAVTQDAKGDVIVGGAFQSGADFGSGPIAANAWSGFVSKRAAADGSEIWTRIIEGTVSGGVSDVMTDPEGNVFAAGRAGSISAQDLVLAKYAPSGELVWQRGFGAASHASGLALARLANGNIVVTGRFHGPVDFGAGPITPPLEDASAFVAAFSPDGVLLWGDAFLGHSSFHSVAVTAGEDLVLAGQAYGDVVIDGVLQAVPQDHGLLASWSAEGELQWVSFVPPLDEHVFVYAVATDEGGNTWASLEESRWSTGEYRSVVAAVSATGAVAVHATQDGVLPRSLAIGPVGDVLVGGFVNGPDPIDLGFGPTVGSMFLAALGGTEPTGAMTYGAVEPPGMADIFWSLAPSAQGLAAAGVFDATIDFGAGPVSAQESQDALVVMFDWVP